MFESGWFLRRLRAAEKGEDMGGMDEHLWAERLQKLQAHSDTWEGMYREEKERAEQRHGIAVGFRRTIEELEGRLVELADERVEDLAHIAGQQRELDERAEYVSRESFDQLRSEKAKAVARVLELTAALKDDDESLAELNGHLGAATAKLHAVRNRADGWRSLFRRVFKRAAGAERKLDEAYGQLEDANKDTLAKAARIKDLEGKLRLVVRHAGRFLARLADLKTDGLQAAIDGVLTMPRKGFTPRLEVTEVAEAEIDEGERAALGRLVAYAEGAVGGFTPRSEVTEVAEAGFDEAVEQARKNQCQYKLPTSWNTGFMYCTKATGHGLPHICERLVVDESRCEKHEYFPASDGCCGHAESAACHGHVCNGYVFINGMMRCNECGA